MGTRGVTGSESGENGMVGGGCGSSVLCWNVRGEGETGELTQARSAA